MINRRKMLLSSAAIGLAAGSQANADPAAEAQLKKALGDIFDQYLDENPELASSLGLDVGARADAKSKLHHASIAALDHKRRQTADQLAQMRGINRGALSGMPAVNYDSICYALELNDRADKRFVYGDDGAGSPYVISQINGAYQEIPDFLDSDHTIETKADCEAYLARLEAFGRLMDEEVDRVRRARGSA